MPRISLHYSVKKYSSWEKRLSANDGFLYQMREFTLRKTGQKASPLLSNQSRFAV